MPTTVPLNSIAKVRMGVTLRGRDATRPDPTGPYRMIQIGDLEDDGSLRTRDFVRIQPREKIPAELFLRQGDVILPSRGTRCAAAVFEEEDPGVLVGAQFFIVRPTSSAVQPAYLAWLLRSDHAAAHFHTHRRGTLVLTLQKPVVESLEVPLPGLNVQAAIVEAAHLGSQARRLENRLAELHIRCLENSLLMAAKRS